MGKDFKKPRGDFKKPGGEFKKPQGEFKKHAKLVVEFDENSRREFLTGFSKRKMERRKQALHQLEAQAREETLATRKQFRDQLLEEKRELLAQAAAVREAEGAAEESDDGDDADKRVLQGMDGKSKVEQLHDDFSSHQFGSAHVTVTTTVADEDATFVAVQRAAQPSLSVKFPKHAKLAQSEAAKVAARLRDKLNKKRTRKNMNTASGKPDKSNKKKARH